MTIVVLNWNRWRETLSCLEALDDLNTFHDVIVVDNGSTDGSEDRLRRARPELRVLQTGANLGYAGGNNRGIRQALGDGADFVWILNNDARPRPDALHALLRIMKREHGLGILASNVQPRRIATALRADKHILCDGCEEALHEADMVLGCSLFIRSKMLREVGVFDERYFHYSEEQDLAMRAYNAGWRFGLACAAVVDHESGSSLPDWSPQASYYKLRNLCLYERRFLGSGTLRCLMRNRKRVRSHLALRTSVRERDARRAVAVLLAIVDAGRGRVGPRDLGDHYHQVRLP